MKLKSSESSLKNERAKSKDLRGRRKSQRDGGNVDDATVFANIAKAKGVLDGKPEFLREVRRLRMMSGADGCTAIVNPWLMEGKKGWTGFYVGL